MVRPWHPEDIEAIHPLKPNQNVLKGIVQSVSDVEDTGYVGRGDDNGVGFAIGIFIGPKIATFFPIAIPFLLHLVGIIRFVQDL
jgi:hypothetical protein